jgi:hypothetical protein
MLDGMPRPAGFDEAGWSASGTPSRGPFDQHALLKDDLSASARAVQGRHRIGAILQSMLGPAEVLDPVQAAFCEVGATSQEPAA